MPVAPRRRLLGALVAAGGLAGVAEGSPHDVFQAQTVVHTAPQHYVDGFEDLVRGASSGGRRLATSVKSCDAIYASQTPQPIRIRHEMMDVEDVPQETIDYVNEVLGNATAYWGSILKVRRAQAPLLAEYSGPKKYLPEDPFPFHLRSGRDLPKQPVCGGDGPMIPAKYLRPVKACDDFCAPQQECTCSDQSALNKIDAATWNQQGEEACCKINTTCSACPDAFDGSRMVARDRVDGQGAYMSCQQNCVDMPGGEGAADTDLHVFVTVHDTAACQENTQLQAYATYCATDQCDRPIFGYINFCLLRMTGRPEQIAVDVSTATHEVAHILVFSSALFPYFRTQEGVPRVPRQTDNPRELVDEHWFSCSGTTIDWSKRGPYRHVDLAEDNGNVINVFPERGMSTCSCPTKAVPKPANDMCVWSNATGGFQVPHCVFKMTTPMVVEKAREHFGCDDLEGAELENQDTTSCVVYASHWEQRLFNGELMCAKHNEDLGHLWVSDVTLAMFEDSGWYTVDFTKKDRLLPNKHWGYKRGCSFARDKQCLENGVPTDSFYCAGQKDDACSLDRTGVRRCSLITSSIMPPDPFVYFGEGVGFMGSNAIMDYCPAFEVKISTRTCVNSASSPNVSPAEVQRELFGSSSRCFMSNIKASVYSGAAIEMQPLCFATECANDKKSYRVGIASSSEGGVEWIPSICRSEEDEVLAVGFVGQIKCAPVEEICEDTTPKHLESVPKELVELSLDYYGYLENAKYTEENPGGTGNDSALLDAAIGSPSVAPAVWLFLAAAAALLSVGRRPFA